MTPFAHPWATIQSEKSAAMANYTANKTIDNPKVPPGLHNDFESRPRRDDEKGERPAIEMGNRDRGPKHEDPNEVSQR